jgi:hypothetical protein
LRSHDVYDHFLVEVGEHALERPVWGLSLALLIKICTKPSVVLLHEKNMEWKLTQQPTSPP